MFKQADDVKDEFTAYEYFLYNDNQNYSTASAPGLGGNLAGVNFNNNLNKGNSPTNLFNTIKKMINTPFEKREKMSLKSRQLIEKQFDVKIVNKIIINEISKLNNEKL